MLSSTNDILSNAASTAVTKQRTAPPCWICQKWVSQDFHFKSCDSDINGEGENEIYIHLNIDQWRSDKMIKSNDGIFRTQRFVPPSFRVEYYFSDSRGNRRLASDQSLVISDADRNTFPNRDEMIGVVNTVQSVSSCDTSEFEHMRTHIRTPWDQSEKPLLWSPACSNFQNRAFTSASRDYVDTRNMWTSIQEKDWSCLKDRVRFLRTIQAFDGTGGILPIRDVLKRHFDLIRSCFAYGAAHLDSLRIGKQQFLNFMLESSITNATRYCKPRQLEEVYRVATDDRESDDMSRFEFVDACVRVGILRYVKGKGKGTVSVRSL